VATDNLEKLLLETFACDREVEHLAQLLDLGAKVRVRQVREDIDAEVTVELDVQIVEVDVEIALYRLGLLSHDR